MKTLEWNEVTAWSWETVDGLFFIEWFENSYTLYEDGAFSHFKSLEMAKNAAHCIVNKLSPCKSDELLDPVEQVARAKKPPINNIVCNAADVFKNHMEPPTDVSYGNAMDLYQALAIGAAFYPGQGTPLGLAYIALKMNGEAGEFAEHVGKAMRDDGLIPVEKWEQTKDVRRYGTAFLNHDALTPERRELLIKEIGDVLWYLSAACNELGINLSEAAMTNIQKLQDRQQRGKLQGSGDDR